jgi:hypothetical protein
VEPQKSLTHGRMPSVALSIKKILSNNQQGGFIAYVAREGNEFIHPAAETMTKIPTSAYPNHFAGEEWIPQPEIAFGKTRKSMPLWGRPHQW